MIETFCLSVQIKAVFYCNNFLEVPVLQYIKLVFWNIAYKLVVVNYTTDVVSDCVNQIF